MNLDEFERIVQQTVGKMPKKFRDVLNNEGIRLLAREKAPRVLRAWHPGGVVFGVFVGVPFDKRSVFNVETEPTRIELYRESFAGFFTDPAEMKEQIVKTVIHEIGHYFGFSEAALRRRKL